VAPAVRPDTDTFRLFWPVENRADPEPVVPVRLALRSCPWWQPPVAKVPDRTVVLGVVLVSTTETAEPAAMAVVRLLRVTFPLPLDLKEACPPPLGGREG
jgi:hypothetical protein